jgi:protein ImuA
MTPPDALALARNRTAVMAELRRLLPGEAAEGLSKTLPFGLASVDSHLPAGGLACGALHEVVPAADGAVPAALGFMAAILARAACSPPPCGEGLGVGVGRRRENVDTLTSRHGPHPTLPTRGREQRIRLPRIHPLLFVMPAYGLHLRHGRLHGHGLRALGLDPARLILVETANRKATLWAMEEALRSAAPAAVAGVIDKLDMKLSQRLHLAAVDCGLPLLLLRPAQTLESSAAATRWRVGTAEAARDRFGLYARPRWHLQLERCRNGRPGEWVVEYDHVAHRFSLAAALADPAFFRKPDKTSEQQNPIATPQARCA